MLRVSAEFDLAADKPAFAPHAANTSTAAKRPENDGAISSLCLLLRCRVKETDAT